jgi:signal transduction histidine kinase
MKQRIIKFTNNHLKLFFIIMLIMVKPFLLSAEKNNPDTSAFSILVDSARSNKFKNFPLALIQIKKAVAIAQKDNDKKKLHKSFRLMGRIYEDNSHIKEAAEAYSKVLDIASSLEDTFKLDIYIDWAIINRQSGNYKISKDYYERTLALAEKINDVQMIEYAYTGIGTLLKVAGDYDQAVVYHLKSAELAEKGGKIPEVVSSLEDISDTYLMSQNYQLALYNIEKAYKLVLKAPDSSKTKRLSRISNVLNAFGKILNAQGDYKGALQKHQEALTNYTEINDNRHIAETLIFIADCYAQMKQYDLAETTFLKCFEYKQYLEFYEHPNFYLKLGKLYQKKNQNEKAIVCLENSVELASKKDFKNLLHQANLALSESYNIKGEYQKAYQVLQKANAFGDSLFNEAKSKKLAEAQFKFDVEKGEKELQAVKARQGYYWLGAAAFFIILIVGVFFYVLKLKNKNTFALLQKSQEIELQNTRLEKSNEILRQFAYASAHDLKEPLRSISSFVHIIQRKYVQLLPIEASEYMTFVINGTKRMEQLLSALLEYSTVASDDEAVKNATNLSKVIDEIKDNLHSIVQEKKGTISAEGTMPTVWITQLHLTQLFQNIVGNALKFSNRPPVVKISCQTTDSQVIIHIKDNGIGMQKEYSDKIFKLFQRLSRSAEGTGIGLAICKHIVDKYNGTIWFDSVEGEGTTFHIAFPISILKQEVDTHTQAETKKELLRLA